MKIFETADGALTVKVTPGIHAYAAAACSLLLAYTFIKEAAGPVADKTAVAGSLTGLLIFLLIFALLYKKSVFRFEPFTQSFSWRRTGLFGGKSGRAGFSDIRDIVVDSTAACGERGPGYRVVILTAGGKIPLTDYYTPENSECEGAAARLLELLCRDAEKLPERSVEHLVTEGRLIDATSAIMQERAVSLTEARSLVGVLAEKHGKKAGAVTEGFATTEAGELEVERLAAAGRKMKAIKLYRRIHRTDLKTSRQEVERIILRLREGLQCQK